jgi:hypothetical protein
VLSDVPFSLVVLPTCEFLHFGTTVELIHSGMKLLEHENPRPAHFTTILPWPEKPVSMNNHIDAAGQIQGMVSWIEGCRIAAPLKLGGGNVVVGVDIDELLELPRGACLDIIAGEYRAGQNAWFVRVYHWNDTFKDTLARGGTLCGRPLAEWFNAVGATANDIWPDEIEEDERSLWNARVFPAVSSPQGYRDWLWMYDPSTATDEQKQAFLAADRYSVAEIALLADMEAFYARRSQLCVTP